MASSSMEVDENRPVSTAGHQVQVSLLATVEQVLSHSTAQPTPEQRIALLQTTAPLFTQLRAIARRAHDDARRGKQCVADARQSVDVASLALQNLDYQKRHLEEEIRMCRDFRSVYQTIPLTDVDDFKGRAPAHDVKPEVFANTHQLQLARLRFELSERKRLEAEKQSVQAQRARLAKENRVKRQRLEGLEHDLKEMLSRSVQVRKRFEEANQERDREEEHEEEKEKEKGTQPASTTTATSPAPVSPDAGPSPHTSADDVS